MDLEAIANGDYSSIVGVWQDDKGNKLVSLTTKVWSPRVRGLRSFDGLWNRPRRHLWWSWMEALLEYIPQE